MSINVNIQVERAVPQLNEEALTLVIFKNARFKSSVTDVLVRPLKGADLLEIFEEPTRTIEESVNPAAMKEFRELHTAEYLLSAGVNIICYATDVVGELDADDVANFIDQETIGYKFIVVPYDFVTTTTAPTALLAMITSAETVIDAELYLDLTPDIATTDIATVMTLIASYRSPKVSLFVNSGFYNATSNFTLPQVGDPLANLNLGQAYLADGSAYAAATDFVGIPASLAVLVRKAKLLLNGKPWLPVAGETYGKITEFSSVYRSLSTKEKEDFQSDNLNVLISRIGVGPLMVSQNTITDFETASYPLIRSHVVTQALWIKRQLKFIANSVLFLPNNQKTWDSVALRLKDILKNQLNNEGIEDYVVLVGRGITMTAEDIANGIMRVSISYTPIRAIESISFDVTIKESENIYDIVLSGGEL